jgi:hypothetical protein
VGKGGPGGWWILDGPEVHTRGDILVTAGTPCGHWGSALASEVGQNPAARVSAPRQDGGATRSRQGERRRHRDGPGGHPALTAAYHMLRDGTSHRDMGAAHFAPTAPTKTARRLVRKLSQLGFQVELKAA